MQSGFRKFTRQLLDLREGAEEKHTIIENVKDDNDFSSARFWTLVCAIVLASIGLNINSVAVIIGAMLISPLMGPIVSMGLALSIYDWGLLRRSFRNLLILTVIGIIISTLYFALTPITAAQSELLARTNPTIFDVLIAIFGGVAGFIGISRAKHGNIIPGVAIATALIPPLCTVGYGIATWQLPFILGAFYLFLINSIFICLSSLVVAKYMKLPKREYPDENHRRRVSRIISALTIIIVAPAIYLASTFVGESRFNTNVDQFISSVFIDEGHIIVYEKREYNRTGNLIELAFLSENFSDKEINAFRDSLNDFRLKNTTLVIRQGGAIPAIDEWNTLLTELKGKDATVIALQNRLDNEREAANSPEQIFKEMTAIESRVLNVALGDIQNSDKDATNSQVIIIKHNVETPLDSKAATTLADWLHTRLSSESLEVVFVPPIATDALETAEDIE